MFKLGKLEFEVESASLFGGFMDAAMSERMAGEGVPEFDWHIEIDMAKGDFVTEISEEERQQQ